MDFGDTQINHKYDRYLSRIFIFLLYLSIFQQLPIIRENYYEIIRYILLFTFGIISVIYFKVIKIPIVLLFFI